MKRRITASEWEELKALSRLEMLGSDRRDYGTAIAGWAAAAAMGWKELKIHDLLPVKPEERGQTDEEMYLTLLSNTNSVAAVPNGSQHSNPGN